MVIGPSLYGMGVTVSVGVTLGVKVSLGMGDWVMVWVAEGVNVLVEVKVRESVEVSVREGVGLIKRALTAGFEENNQTPITKIPNTRLNIQKLVTILPSDFGEDLGINLPPMRCVAGYQAPC
jgi:hypothetical protein